MLNVANNSNSMLPWYYKVAATWGSHEGSILFWTVTLGWWGAAVAFSARKLPEDMVARVTGVMGLVGMGFLLFAAAGMGIDSTALEGIDFPKLNEILGLDEKNLTAIAAVSLGYRSPKDGNAQRPKSRLTRDELFTSLD